MVRDWLNIGSGNCSSDPAVGYLSWTRSRRCPRHSPTGRSIRGRTP